MLTRERTAGLTARNVSPPGILPRKGPVVDDKGPVQWVARPTYVLSPIHRQGESPSPQQHQRRPTIGIDGRRAVSPRTPSANESPLQQQPWHQESPRVSALQPMTAYPPPPLRYAKQELPPHGRQKQPPAALPPLLVQPRSGRVSGDRNRSPSMSRAPLHGRCSICMERQSVIMLLPCHHLCLCEKCLEHVLRRRCPYCNKPFTKTTRVRLT
ncbi:hypothetical protein DQ04_08891030 [Trypanosoma grayi]|uniref:hypothetical protein n=1 Tax=Trypanosoma grayi TaxID=71804 RepID=UPI0004F414D6|nr:hypothetical protein DQ04_08891030 [Trypanosoma grayi]KEG07760.1 hypothetical protein DQ04_08891030 [Trypanosoma grayi]